MEENPNQDGQPENTPPVVDGAGQDYNFKTSDGTIVPVPANAYQGIRKNSVAQYAKEMQAKGKLLNDEQIATMASEKAELEKLRAELNDSKKLDIIDPAKIQEAAAMKSENESLQKKLQEMTANQSKQQAMIEQIQSNNREREKVDSLSAWLENNTTGLKGISHIVSLTKESFTIIDGNLCELGPDGKPKEDETFQKIGPKDFFSIWFTKPENAVFLGETKSETPTTGVSKQPAQNSFTGVFAEMAALNEQEAKVF